MKRLFLIFSTLLYTNSSFSHENVHSDFYFPLTVNAVASLFRGGASGVLAKDIQDFKVRTPYATAVSGITVDFNYDYRVSSNDERGLVSDFVLTLQDLKIHVGNVQTQDKERRSVGNIILDVEVKGQCRDIGLLPDLETLEVLGQMTLSNTSKGTPMITAQIKTMEWPQNWFVTDGNCSGPAGYKEAVKIAIKKAAQSKKEEVTKLFENEINQWAQQALLSALDKVMHPIDFNLTNSALVHFQPEEVRLDDVNGGFLVKGLVTAQQHSQKDSNKTIPFSLTPKASNLSNNTGLIMSHEFLNSVFAMIQRSGDLHTTFESQKIAGLKSLHQSRFYQFFAFPDLMKFSKRANFLLKTFLSTAPLLKFRGQQDQFTWFGYQTDIKVNVQAPKPEGYLPYMYYRMPIRGHLWMTVHQEKLVVGVDRPQSEFQASWDGNYIKKYNTNRRFSSRLFHREVDKLIERQRFNLNLPPIELDETKSLRPSRIFSEDNAIQLIYELNFHQ